MKSVSLELFDSFADDLLVERAPRPLIIVGASKVDSLLLDVLTSFLLPKIAKATQRDELLEGDRPLATFSSRIKACYRLGLIDSSLYSCLEILREIRNDCAHEIGFDISQSPTREHIVELRKAISTRKTFEWTKQRWFEGETLTRVIELQCLLLTLCVILEAVREKTKRTPGNKATMKIAAL